MTDKIIKPITAENITLPLIGRVIGFEVVAKFNSNNPVKNERGRNIIERIVSRLTALASRADS
jgi:hypothetical protein